MPTTLSTEFDCDLLVIGAGIHGAAVAREAAARGWRVQVVEQYDKPAAATSSRSSKLIHGGLRYLETGQFRLVYECLREQRILLNTAPQLVHKRPFFIPLRPGMRRPGWAIHAGLLLYWLLGGQWPKRLAAAFGEVDGLRRQEITAVLGYQDAQTDDAPLTAAVLASAELMGATVRYGASVSGMQLEAAGATVNVRMTDGQGLTLRTRAVANLSGPWVRDVLATVNPALPLPAVELVRGSHIVLPDAPRQGCYYLEAEDGRAVFVMPWRGRRLVGTTEAAYTGDPAAAAPTEPEIAYLLRTHNRFFKPAFQREQVLDSWSGLRVLPQGEGSAFKRPRESVLLTDRADAPRLLSLIGGKLTSHRATATQICRRLTASLPPIRQHIDTKRQKLPAVVLPTHYSL